MKRNLFNVFFDVLAFTDCLLDYSRCVNDPIIQLLLLFNLFYGHF